MWGFATDMRRCLAFKAQSCYVVIGEILYLDATAFVFEVAQWSCAVNQDRVVGIPTSATGFPGVP